jgi:hypothetical protein
MEKLFSKAEDLASDIKEYVNLRIESLKLEAAEKSSSLIANGVARLAIIIFIFFFLLMSSVALALLLGAWTGRLWTGFLIMGGFYLLLSVIVWTTRTKLIRLPVMNSIIHQLFKEDHEKNK